MSQPTSPEEVQTPAPAIGARRPGDVAASPAVAQDPPILGGGPALPGWDSELEEALEEAKHIGRF